jgi:hypothetical protein
LRYAGFKSRYSLQATERLTGQQPVLRIHNILVWIRIRGSMPPTNESGFGSDPDSDRIRMRIRILLFSSFMAFKMPIKTKLKKSLAACYFLKVLFT